MSKGDSIFFGGVDGTVIRWKGEALQTLVTKPWPIGVIATLSATSNNVFALGTGGVAVFRDSYFQMLSFAEPELAHTVSGLVEARDGDVWINGSRGIVRIPASEMIEALRNPSRKIAAERIYEGDFVGPATWWKPNPSAIMDIHGKLWFSTLNGVVSFDHEFSTLPSRLPQLSIRSISADGQPLEPASTFPSKVQAVNIRYFGINLTSPEKVTYRYRLDGQDDTWQNVGHRTEAIYTRLKPGRYTFHVVASNGDGMWTVPVSSGQFSVRPYFYQTWWFVSLSVLFGLFLVWFALKVRLTLAYRTITMRAEDRADERVQIARELHDTLLQGVQGLLLTFHVAAQRSSADEASRRLMERALTTADRLIIEGRNRVTNLRSEHLADGELLIALQGVASDLSSDTPIQCSINKTGNESPLDVNVVDEIFYIAREALTNAFRHSGARQIILELDYKKNAFSMTCRDDGRGFDALAVETIAAEGHWGLRGMLERAERISGKISWRSASGEGTTVQITIPGYHAYRRKSGILHFFQRMSSIP